MQSIRQICIPRIDSSISRDTIFKTFCRIKWGYIEKITEIPHKNNAQYKRIIIKLKWNMNLQKNREIHDRLAQDQQVCLVYNMPWYWKIFAYK
jgi:hypothetical protein